jgi:hypothetical protein
MDLARWLAPVPLVALGLATVAAAVLGWRVGRTDGTARNRALEAANQQDSNFVCALVE